MNDNEIVKTMGKFILASKEEEEMKDEKDEDDDMVE